MLNLWAVTPVGSTRFEGVATSSVVTHREEATPTHREEATPTRRVALIHRSCTLAARCEEREKKEKQPHPLKQRSTRDTREKKETAKKKASSLTKLLLHLLLRGGKVQRVLKGEALCLRQRASFFMHTRKEVNKGLRAKPRQRTWRKESTYIHTREYVYIEN